MKKKFILLLFLFAPLNIFGLNIEFKASKVFGLYYFLEVVSGFSGQYHTYETYKQSKFNNETSKKYIDDFLTLKKTLKQKISGHNVRELLIIRSIFSKNLSDFNENIYGLLPANEHELLLNALRYFMPIYEELIWNRRESAKYLREIKKTYKKYKIDRVLDNIAKFYKYKQSKNLPIVVGFYLVPDFPTDTEDQMSQSIANVNITIINPHGSKKTGVNIYVIVHETAHSLYHRSSKEEVENYMRNKVPFLLINEGIATVFGCMAQYKITENSCNWYANEHITNFAKAIYPLVDKYISEERSIDSNFLEESIKIANKTRPKIRKYEDIFAGETTIALYYSGKSIPLDDIKNIPHNFFKFSDMYVFFNPDTETAEKNIKEKSNANLFIIFDNERFDEIEKLLKDNPEISTHLADLNKYERTTVLTGSDKQNRIFVIIKLSSKNDLEIAMQKLKNIANPPEKPAIMVI